MDVVYKIEFHSFWHMGSGLSGGVLVDQTVLKTEPHKLPYIPGKTAKGMLSWSASCLAELDTSLITEEFGLQVFGSEVFGRTDNCMGTRCHFSNVSLPENLMEDAFLNNASFLYQRIASTAIDENGQAIDHSLREMEAVIPLVLFGQIIDFPDSPSFLDQLDHCMKFIKQMGLKRHRGFGRCDWSIVKESAQ